MIFYKSIDVVNFIEWLNPKFLYHSVWQIQAEALKKDIGLEKELIEKKNLMTLWATDILKPVYAYCIDGIPTLDLRTNFKALAFQIVTIGKEAVEKAKELRENGEYLNYFYWHGFCSALTEALAARVHAIIRVELGFEKKEEQSPEKEFKLEYPGKRLSFGYESLPDIQEQNKVLQYLKAEKIGIVATESGMLEPEYSTCAVIFNGK